MKSFAQNFEDVILWRAFRNVDNGFYIDLGAGDPISDSVSHWFYRAGWTGIDVEPNSVYFEKLAASRSRNLVLCNFVEAVDQNSRYRLRSNSVSL